MLVTTRNNRTSFGRNILSECTLQRKMLVLSCTVGSIICVMNDHFAMNVVLQANHCHIDNTLHTGALVNGQCVYKSDVFHHVPDRGQTYAPKSCHYDIRQFMIYRTAFCVIFTHQSSDQKIKLSLLRNSESVGIQTYCQCQRSILETVHDQIILLFKIVAR